ncbi:MAG: AMP-binding protein, partial [Dysgonomonas sp.]|uniref:AMP-binding protein n=1 Tax=Dysgonomonas sp. TaxID=1891233 RepID=UPI003A892ACD
MIDTHISNIFWSNKIQNIEYSKPIIGDEYSVVSRRISIEKMCHFLKISKDNSLSKLSIISSVFSFLLYRTIGDFNGVILISPSDKLSLKNPILLKFENKIDVSFKASLNHAAVEVKEAYIHRSYNDKLDLEIYSDFSIRYNAVNQDNLNNKISLFYQESEKEIEFTISFRRKYETYLIENILDKFCEILINYHEILNENLGSYSLLDENEKHLLLIGFNDTKTDYPRDKTIVDLFEEQVLKTPDNIALVFEDKELTYKGLNEKANQLANYINNEYTIKHQQVIGVLLPKSTDLLISFLAAQKL